MSCSVQVTAVSLHNPNLLYQFTNSRMDLGRNVHERATEESYRHLVVGNNILLQHTQRLLHVDYSSVSVSAINGAGVVAGLHCCGVAVPSPERYAGSSCILCAATACMS